VKKAKPKKKVVLNQRIVGEEMAATLIADYLEHTLDEYLYEAYLDEVVKGIREGKWRK
jgi:hypothetical protein